MTITALIPYFGGKRELAPRIVEEITARGVPAFFAEPFAGSMAVSLAMPPVRTHVVNDRHGDVVNLARVLASDDGATLVERLRRTLFAEPTYRDALELLEDAGAGPFRRAWAFAVASWMGPNGSPQDDAGRFCVRWGPGGGDPATRWRAASEAIDGFRDRLRRFTITNRDAFDVLASIQDANGAAIYVDPPYLLATRGAGTYIHDFTDHGGGIFGGQEDDHDRLAAAVARFERARIVVSYYDDPRLDELYPEPRWRRVILGSAAGVINATGATGRERVEVLLVNDGPKPAAGGEGEG